MKNKKIILILSCIILTVVYIGYPYIKEANKCEDGFKEKIIRFHVIANSDSKYDQSLKLRVRDEILSDMKGKLDVCKSIDESRKVLSNNLNEIKYIASNQIKQEGKDYPVEVFLGQDKFPTKCYGNVTFPAGEYETLKVIIGDGKGKNWWCVMFPPLCFVDIDHGASQDAEEELKTVLAQEEYEMLLTNKEPEVKLKSKLVEVFGKTKSHFAKLFIGKN